MQLSQQLGDSIASIDWPFQQHGLHARMHRSKAEAGRQYLRRRYIAVVKPVGVRADGRRVGQHGNRARRERVMWNGERFRALLAPWAIDGAAECLRGNRGQRRRLRAPEFEHAAAVSIRLVVTSFAAVRAADGGLDVTAFGHATAAGLPCGSGRRRGQIASQIGVIIRRTRPSFRVETVTFGAAAKLLACIFPGARGASFPPACP